MITTAVALWLKPLYSGWLLDWPSSTASTRKRVIISAEDQAEQIREMSAPCQDLPRSGMSMSSSSGSVKETDPCLLAGFIKKANPGNIRPERCKD
jgi:hypothetical protein